MAGLSFASPQWLWLLLFPLALAVGYLAAQRRRTRYTIKLTTVDLLASVMPKRPRWRRHTPPVLLILGATALVLALANPVHRVPGPPRASILVLALDVSPSMQARDVPPSRFVAEKRAARTFVTHLPDGAEVGLVSFAATARIAVTPTTDHRRVAARLGTLQLRSNTSLTQAVLTSLNAIRAAGMPRTPAGIVLLSDGKSTVGAPAKVATRAARDARVPVSTIALGTPHGTVTLVDGKQAVPVDDSELARLARATGGQSFTTATQAGLRTIYHKIGATLTHPFTLASLRIWVILAGLVLIAAAAAGSLLWFAQLP
jgi:Ca-activated chloride channel family protein